MRLVPIVVLASLVQAVFCAVAPSTDERRAVTFGNHHEPLKLTRDTLSRRGKEYSITELDDLEEEAESASKDSIYKAIDHLTKLFKDKSIDYGLMGGVAMQLFGLESRDTHDADLAVSVNSGDLLKAIQDDPNIQRPGRLMAASGTARIFVKIGNQQVAMDVFVKGADQTPSLDTQTIKNYKVIKPGEIAKSKFKRLEDKDSDDILWLIQNKKDDIKKIADKVKKDDRVKFAEDFKDKDDVFKVILDVLDLDEDDVDD
ncbi:hypothetical protein JX265_003738 [Neoarthrinium moseri]|uniref:Uncharacterized protein n=1 Tax=Neoarthrinium moseri TaxID=1658444 RepID=A0A9Q0ASI0_9PEZI|nr:hypothetical protein JX266_009898 [Neoarthrinium moseri]KAI1877730.1 hypothetical protein JX265_003738 [Neoarthrinium moseri]